MNNNNKKRDLALKIIIPIFIIAVITFIWFFKEKQEKQKFASIEITETTININDDITKKNSELDSTEETEKQNTGNINDNSSKTSSSETTTVKSEETYDSTSKETESTEEQKKVNTDFLLTTSNLNLDKLKLYGLPILIDFGADECIPCKQMAPVLEKLNKEWQGKVIVKFVDVWKYPDAAAGFPLQVIPTQFFFDAHGNPYVPSNPEEKQMLMYYLKDSGKHVYTAHQGALTEEQIREIFKEMGVK